MLHSSKIPDIIEKTDNKGKKPVFSLVFIKRSTGEKVSIEKATCTSSHHAPRTYNIMLVDSGEIRTIYHQSIIELNGTEIYM